MLLPLYRYSLLSRGTGSLRAGRLQPEENDQLPRSDSDSVHHTQHELCQSTIPSDCTSNNVKKEHVQKRSVFLSATL